MEFIDLFSGAGGFSQGIIQAGHKVILAVDNWEAASINYRLNFNNEFINADLSNKKGFYNLLNGLQKPDVIVGGPPCQDFSTAGKGVEGSRANLTKEFAQIVAEMKPSIFIMENVPNSQKSNSFREAINLFKKIGYGITQIVLDSCFYNVPQKRKRIFVIGHLGSEDNFIEQHLLMKQNILPMTISQAFPNMKEQHFYRHPRTYKRRGVFSIHEPSPTLRGISRDMPKNYKHHPGDTSKKRNIKSLTFDQRVMVQTFPNNYKWEGRKSDIEQMLGNAVPPNFAMHILQAIDEYLEGKIPNGELKIFTDNISNDLSIEPQKAYKKAVDFRKQIIRKVNLKKESYDEIIFNSNEEILYLDQFKKILER